MPNISKWNGYDLKDAQAREMISELEERIGSLSVGDSTGSSEKLDGIEEKIDSLTTKIDSLTTMTNTLMTNNNLIVGKIEHLTALVNALGEGGFGEDVVTMIGITAIYEGGDVLVGTKLSELTGITVTANYSDSTSTNVTDYTLSGGDITLGNNSVMVIYNGFATSFNVTGVTEVEAPSLLTLNNRTLNSNWTQNWFYEDYYFNPSDYNSATAPSVMTPCGIADLTESSITVTEPGGAGGKGVSFPWEIHNDRISRRGKSFTMTWDTIAGGNARFRVRVGGVSNPAYIDLSKGSDGKTSATFVVSEDGYSITINGTKITRTDDYIGYIAFFFGSATGTTTAYKNVKLIEQ